MAAALPALAQAAAAILPSLLGGGGDNFKKLPTMTKGQQGIQGSLENFFGNKGGQQGGLSQILQQLMMQLQGGGEAEQAFGKQYERQFQEQTLPNIAERFAGGCALSSSGFG
jgi:hypothetical protein